MKRKIVFHEGMAIISNFCGEVGNKKKQKEVNVREGGEVIDR